MGATELQLLKVSATAMARAVRAREVSPVELFDLHAARIEERDGAINALVERRLDEARAEAVAAARALDAGEEVGLLHGVPFTAKEAFAVAGMPWTHGSRLFANDMADHDAPAITRMRAAGAILLGKTNVPEFSTFYDTVNEVFGATANPHDPTRSAGGSSGGESAAIGAAMSPAGVGSDLGSSIRNPAHFVGIFGLKPSRGLVSMSGYHPRLLPCFRLFTGTGPLARHAEDLELLLDVLAGEAAPLAARPGLLPIAVFEEDGLQPVSRACRDAVRLAAAALAGAGHEVTEDRPPGHEQARAHYDTAVTTDMVLELVPFARGREDELSPLVRGMFDQLSGLQPSAEAYVRALVALGELEREVDAWFERHPIALCPVGPDTAPMLDAGGFADVDGEPLNPGGKFTLCTFANAFGLPAASVPAGRADNGLPVGVQVIGARGRDRDVIGVAHILERELGGWTDPDESA